MLLWTSLNATTTDVTYAGGIFTTFFHVFSSSGTGCRAPTACWSRLQAKVSLCFSMQLLKVSGSTSCSIWTAWNSARWRCSGWLSGVRLITCHSSVVPDIGVSVGGSSSRSPLM
ncbi:Os01g0127100 [Oryza sativa Japonica Group]|uniref:Os01g0127100 protein n=2 Tax=Oryza sativa subsp. japonica TaxID=39947 RepID=Q0JR13_ORYSJ|nr:hypothetical protein EE612_000028 [Oryza sativa]BAF03815.1 Os01g0127100 [Oryza sativa Japonica Group]BAS70181.1 Os01g0127100 [Oryza sativa Japonica Group]|eukprot:NP_001041901.1 Os01g0127100 [Oryza sativa Japonica Group]